MNRQHKGFSLIEVLVAMVILAIGLLGLASMQTVSMRNIHSAYMRSQASVLAYDMLDRIRANANQAVTTTSYLINFGIVAPSSSDCTSSACTPSQMAAYDLSRWKTALANTLPSGDGRIVAGTGNGFVITVQWDDSRGTEPLQEFSIRSES